MADFEKQLQEIVNKKNILKNEPMSKHTSLKIGGNADYFVIVSSVDELKNVINLDFKSFKIKRSSNEIFITAESGMSLAALASVALKEEIAGVEFLSGIPGTIGGAIRMNAGAYGSEMKDILVRSRYMTYDGKIKTLTLDEHKFEYRNSIFSSLDGIIIDTTIKGKKGIKEEIEEKMQEYSKSRKEHQPLEYPNAGSTFKRIETKPTAKIIDECGLKGFSVGDAEVSTKHAGFIVNKGKASAKDVLELISHIKKEVKKKFNVDIELEILVLGDEK